MDRPVTVGAQDGQIVERGLDRSSRLCEGSSMVNLSHVSTKTEVCMLRDKSACLAFEFTSLIAGGGSLRVGNAWFALPAKME